MRRLFFLAACVLACVSAAQADTVHFTYTNINFNLVHSDGTLSQSYTTSDHLSGYVDASVADSYLTTPNQSYIPNTVLDFSFTDGVQTLDQTNATIDFNFSTRAAGVVSYFNFYVNSLSNPFLDFIEAGHYQFSNSALAEINLNNSAQSPSSGTLTYAVTSVTPEPSSFALLGTGVLGIAGIFRKRLL